MYFKDFHVVQPIVIQPSDQQPPSDDELQLLADHTVGIQDWFLFYQQAMQIAPPLLVYSDKPLSYFTVTPLERVTGIVYGKYTALMEQGQIIALVIVKGLTNTMMGAEGWGWYQYCMIAWNRYLELNDEQKVNQICGIICHEIGHGLSLPHFPNLENNVMWHHYRWPNVMLPGTINAGEHAATHNPDEVCPDEQ